MTRQEKAERFARSAPPMRKKDLEKINSLFTPYIFRRAGVREIWTTCCYRHTFVSWDDMMAPSAERDFYSVMYAEHQREPRYSRDERPIPGVRCPFCGTPAIVKELRYTGKRENLKEFHRAVLLRWYRGVLWATGWDCTKRYGDAWNFEQAPKCKLVGVYRFRPGLAEGTSRDWWGDMPFTGIMTQENPLTKGRWNVHGPFHWCSEYGMDYDVIGLGELQKSPFRYCMAEKYEEKYTRFIEFLEACCFYPRQIEMLMKADMADVVYDLVDRGVKHAIAIDWSREKPTESFRLSKPELREFLETDRKIETLELYKRLKGRVPMAEISRWVSECLDVREVFRQSKKWNLHPECLIRYLYGQVGCTQYGGLASAQTALRFWKDYVDAAEALGDYPLHHDNVLLPRSLGQAHDEATRRHREILQERYAQQERQRREQWEAKETERLKKQELDYAERRKKLEKKYAFALDGYLIRVPANAAEILEEGRVLKHCVGGYAERHIKGKVVILFMREEKHPDKPWLTIEMKENDLVQIHGFRNEGLFTREGRIAPDPREVYRDFLDTWLAWLERGSKRDNDGNPRLPKVKVRVPA